jgi:hypothetical protein
MTSYSWNNPNGGLWNLSSNWTPTGIPGAGDSATITLPGTYTVTDSDPLSITSGNVLAVDNGSGQGGVTLAIGGTLANSGVAQVGPNNLTLSGPSKLSVGGLTNASGASLRLYGSSTHAVTLALTAANAFTANSGDFEEYYATPLTISNGFTNNSGGTFGLHDNTAVTTTGGFTNGGTLVLDNAGGEGGSSLTVGGTLDNSGTVQFGNPLLSAATTITLGGLTNSGTSDVFAINGSSAHAATLTVTGAVHNDARILETNAFVLLEDGLSGSGEVSIGAGSTLEVQGTITNGETITFAGSGAYLHLDNPDSATDSATTPLDSCFLARK